jgi:hypothetical protein
MPSTIPTPLLQTSERGGHLYSISPAALYMKCGFQKSTKRTTISSVPYEADTLLPSRITVHLYLHWTSTVHAFRCYVNLEFPCVRVLRRVPCDITTCPKSVFTHTKTTVFVNSNAPALKARSEGRVLDNPVDLETMMSKDEDDM